MGYVWGGKCHQDTGAALAAFVRDMSVGDGGGVNSFSAVPTIDASGVITWSIENQRLTSADTFTRSGTTALQSCDAGIAQWSPESILWVLALFFAAVFGFRSGFRP